MLQIDRVPRSAGFKLSESRENEEKAVVLTVATAVLPSIPGPRR